MRWLFAVLLAVPLTSACGTEDSTVLALLVADATSGTTRAVDTDAFEEKVESTCRACSVVVHDAEGDPDEQRRQVRQVLAESADVVVVEPIDPAVLADLDLGEVPVVSVGVLADGADLFVGLEDDLSAEGARARPVLEEARDLVLGEQDSFVHVPVREMSEQSADVAVALLADEPVEGGEDHEGVRSWLYETQEIDLSNLATTLVGQQVITLEELCAGSTARRCERLGLR